MNVDYLAKELPSIGLVKQDSLRGVAALMKDLVVGAHVNEDEDKISYWQLIFLQSKSNGCLYSGEDLPSTNWQWPKDTWFQERLSHHLKDLELLSQQGQK
jgi:hypothetical protein